MAIIKTLDFWCPENGTKAFDCIKIKIPDVCCNKQIMIANPGKATMAGWFSDGCATHMDTYPKIWNKFGPLSTFAQILVAGIVAPMGHPQGLGSATINHFSNEKIVKAHHHFDGMNCIRCKNPVPMAAPNQEDGSFKCFGCRTYG